MMRRQTSGKTGVHAGWSKDTETLLLQREFKDTLIKTCYEDELNAIEGKEKLMIERNET